MTARGPEVGIHSGWPLEDPRSWSGVVAPMVEQIENRLPSLRLPSITASDALVDRVRARLSSRTVLPRHSLATAKRRSRELRRRVDEHPVDALVSIASSTDLVIAPGPPVLQVTDATFDAITDFYPQYSGLGYRSLHHGRAVERLAAANTSHFLVASHWARRSLIEAVEIPPERITVAPFGPAIAPPAGHRPHTSSHDEPLRLLLVAGDWHRKNGDAALEIHAFLRERVDAHLTVVGDAPSLTGRPDVTALGRLDREALSLAYASSDVLLEPSRANAAGVVITDALSHGLPVLAADTGGTSTLVQEAIGGWTVPADRLVSEAVSILSRVTREQLHALSLAAMEDARNRLSWSAWGDAAEKSITATVHAAQFAQRRASRPA